MKKPGKLYESAMRKLREGRAHALSSSEVGAVIAHDDELRDEKKRKRGRPPRTAIDKFFDELAVTAEFELLRGQGLSQEQAEAQVAKKFRLGKSTIWARIGAMKRSVPAAAAIRGLPDQVRRRLNRPDDVTIKDELLSTIWDTISSEMGKVCSPQFIMESLQGQHLEVWDRVFKAALGRVVNHSWGKLPRVEFTHRQRLGVMHLVAKAETLKAIREVLQIND